MLAIYTHHLTQHFYHQVKTAPLLLTPITFNEVFHFIGFKSDVTLCIYTAHTCKHVQLNEFIFLTKVDETN